MTIHLTAENTIMPGSQGWVPGEVLLRYGPKPRGNKHTNTIQQCRTNKQTIIVISIARINEHNTSFYYNQQNEMNEIFNCSYAAIERVYLSMLDTTDH